MSPLNKVHIDDKEHIATVRGYDILKAPDGIYSASKNETLVGYSQTLTQCLDYVAAELIEGAFHSTKHYQRAVASLMQELSLELPQRLLEGNGKDYFVPKTESISWIYTKSSQRKAYDKDMAEFKNRCITKNKRGLTRDEFKTISKTLEIKHNLIGASI